MPLDQNRYNRSLSLQESRDLFLIRNLFNKSPLFKNLVNGLVNHRLHLFSLTPCIPRVQGVLGLRVQVTIEPIEIMPIKSIKTLTA